MPKSSKPVYRIGSGAGFAGDRVDPAVALAASGQVDAVGAVGGQHIQHAGWQTCS